MKPDYKNWIPKGMLYSLIAGTLLSLVLLLILGVFGIGVSGKLRIALGVVFGIAFVVCAKYTSGACMPIGAFPMTANESSQNRSSKEPHVMSPCRRAALGWMWAAAAER